MRWSCFTLVWVMALLGAAQAGAYLSHPGGGSARASVTTLSAPTLGAPAASSGTTQLTWTDAKLAGRTNTGMTYVVQRRGAPSETWTTIASGPCQSTPTPLPSTTTSCTDPVGSSANLSYRVIARFRTFTAASNEAGVAVRVLDHFVLGAAASSTAGTTVPLPITAVDAAGATVVTYTGTVTLTSSDPAATVPSSVTFAAGDAGSRLISSGVVLRTAGQRSVTAQDAGSPAITGSANVTVTPAAAAQLAFTRQPSTPTAAGTTFATQPVVAVQDAYGNVVTGGPASTVTLALTNAQGATLSCGPSGTGMATSNGVATFAGCAVSAPGTYTLTATTPGLTSAQSTSLTITRRAQTIAFSSTAPAAARVGGPAYAVTATASSGLAVTFSLASGSSGCAVSGSTVSFTGVGTCRIQADQAGDGTYAAAPSTVQAFAVGKGSQTVAFTSTAPTEARVGGPAYTASASATSGSAVTLASATPTVCAINNATGVVTFAGVGTCTLTADQGGNANYNAAPQAQQSFAVGKGSQAIAFTSTAPAAARVGGPAYTATATSDAGLPVTLGSATPSVCAINSSTGVVTFAAAGTCTITADQAGNANYNAATQVQQSFTVAKGSQTITFTSTPPNPGAVNATYTPTATASTGLPVTITVATASASTCRINATTGVVTLLATGTCTLNANQAGNANYNAAPLVQQSFLVGAGLRITSATVTSAGSGRYNFSGSGVGGTLNSGTITITICSISVVPCPTANVVDANAVAYVLLSTTFTTSTSTGVLANGTYYAEAAQSGTTLFSPPFPFTVP